MIISLNPGCDPVILWTVCQSRLLHTTSLLSFVIRCKYTKTGYFFIQ